MARSIEPIQNIVKHTAQRLVNSDEAAFILRDRQMCYYADEDTISPLWKGPSFDMDECISGWVMKNKQSLVIRDIYQDPRIPIDVYRQTLNAELEAFTYSVSHDLRSPLTVVGGLSQMIQHDNKNVISPDSKYLFTRMDTNVKPMNELIDGLLMLSKISQVTVNKQYVNVSVIAHESTIRAHETFS